MPTKKYPSFDFEAPELYGWPLLIAANLAERVPFLAYKIAKDANMFDLRDYPDLDEIPTLIPIPQEYMTRENSKETNCWQLDESQKSRSPFHSFWDYHEAYKSQKTTPSKVAEKLLERLEASKACHWMRTYDGQKLIDQAAESTERYRQGKPLSPLDGVFISIKEEISIAGFESKAGTSFLNDGQPAQEDSVIIKRLREAGAIIAGHTVMNELGWDTFTVNPNTGTPQNPYHRQSSCGGSSGGSSGSVASGLFPISFGADSGGSIRLPAAFCGIYGLKPTFARMPTTNEVLVSPSLDVFGPMAGTVDDLAMAYAIAAGPDAGHPASLYQPPVTLKDYGFTDSLEGITIALVPDWTSNTTEPAFLQQMKVFQRHLELLGAKFVTLDIPEINLYRRAHLVTISVEINNFARRVPVDQQKRYLPHTRIMMQISDLISSSEYIRAQQIRTRALDFLCRIFRGKDGHQKIDLILTPTSAIQPIEIPEKAHSYGMTNTMKTIQTMTYVHLASFTGIPAVTVPAGFHNNKPLALQFMAEWYNEALLLRIAKVCEQMPGIERKRPEELWFGDLLD